MTNFWWIFSLGTITFLTLVIGLVSLVLSNQKVKFRLQQEKLTLLKESEAKYRNLFNNVSDVIYIHGSCGEILDISGSVTRLLGYEVNEIKGKSIREFIIPSLRRGVDTYLKDVFRHEGELTGVIPVYSRDKQKIVILEYRSSANRIDGREALFVHGVARDVTAQKMYERSLRHNDTKMRRLLQQSQTMRHSLEVLSREILKVQENEREQISRELHDEISQMIATITMNLEIIRTSVPAIETTLLEKVQDTQDLTGSVLNRIRNFLRQLRPAALDDLGLLPALRVLVDEFTDRSGISVELQGEDAVEKLSREKKVVLYRVVQESLTNAWKHAHPNHIAVSLRSSDGSISLEVHDDGRGFEIGPDQMFPYLLRGLGLLGMRERVKLVSGEFTVRSESSTGTSVQVNIPLNSDIHSDPHEKNIQTK